MTGPPNLLMAFPELPACLAIMLACALRGLWVPRDQWRCNWMMIAAALQVPLQIFIVEVLSGLSLLRPLKYDLYLYRVDAVFGQPSFILGAFSRHHAWFADAMILAYSQLVILMMISLAVQLWTKPKREAVCALIAFAITFPAAVPFYLLLPVAGPRYAFPEFPSLPAAVTPHLIPLTAAPNGFPSIHMATAMLVFWYLRESRWGKFVGGGFAILTALATMASGQHYFVDLIFAAPYAVLMVWIAARLIQLREKDERAPATAAAALHRPNIQFSDR